MSAEGRRALGTRVRLGEVWAGEHPISGGVVMGAFYFGYVNVSAGVWHAYVLGHHVCTLVLPRRSGKPYYDVMWADGWDQFVDGSGPDSTRAWLDRD